MHVCFDSSVDKESACNAGDPSSIPGLRGSGAGTLGVPLGGTRRVGGLLGVAGRLSGTVPPFIGEASTRSRACRASGGERPGTRHARRGGVGKIRNGIENAQDSTQNVGGKLSCCLFNSGEAET